MQFRDNQSSISHLLSAKNDAIDLRLVLNGSWEHADFHNPITKVYL